MDFLRLLIALGLPWLLGSLMVHHLLPNQGTNRRMLVVGYGFVGGFLTLTLLMRGLDALAQPLTPYFLIGALLAAIVVFGGLQLGLRRPLGSAPRFDALASLPRWQQILVICLLAAVAVRVTGLWLEVSWLPLFPWDAYMHWATKAKVWTHAQALIPFVDYDEWLALQGAGVYTDYHPDYPITVPLIQTWMNLVLGRWDDSLMNLPWVFLLVSGAMMFFAQARRAGVAPLAATMFCYLLVSMPIVNLQVALAGYADIFMGFFYLAASMAFYHWANDRDWPSGTLALVFALACPLIKNEGLFWVLTFLPGLAAVFLTRRRCLLLLLIGLPSIVALSVFFPRDLQIAGHTLDELNLHFRPHALFPLLQSLFVFANWHLLFWLLTTMVVANMVRTFWTHEAWPTSLVALGTVAGTATALWFILFLFTGYAEVVVRHTSESRIALQLAPTLLFFTLLLFRNLSYRDAAKSRS